MHANYGKCSGSYKDPLGRMSYQISVKDFVNSLLVSMPCYHGKLLQHNYALYVVNLLQDFDKQFTCMWSTRIHDWLPLVNPKTMTYQNLYMIYQHHDL